MQISPIEKSIRSNDLADAPSFTQGFRFDYGAGQLLILESDDTVYFESVGL